MSCRVTSHWRSWFYGYFPLGISGLLPDGGEGGLRYYSSLGERVDLWLLPAGEVGFSVTPHWRRGWVASRGRVLWLLPTGEVGFRLLPPGREGGLHEYSLLGERIGFYGYFPQGKLVSGLLPAGEREGCMSTPCWGEGGYFMTTSRWGNWFQCYSPLEERVGCMSTPRCWRGRVLWLLPTGKVGFRLLPPGREGGLHEYSLLGERMGIYGYFLLGKLVSGLLPAGGEGGLHE